MNDFLTWNARHIHEYSLGEKIWLVLCGVVGFGIILYIVFSTLGRLIKWINKKFFTVYEWELDDIDMEEKSKWKQNLTLEQS